MEVEDVKVEIDESSEAAELDATKESVEKVDETSEESETSKHDVAKEESKEEDEEKKPEPKKAGGFQRRIEKKDRQISTLEQEKEYWRQEALRNSKTESKVDDKTPKEGKRPKLESYKDPDEWAEALDDYLTEKATKKAAELVKSEQQETAKKSAEASQAEAWADKITAAQDKYDDFDEVTSSLNLTPAMSKVLLKSEVGPEVGYFLGSNPDELKKIARMTDVLDVARAIGQIEGYIAELETEGDSKAEEPKKKETPVSKAPPPLSATRKTSSTTVDWENLSPDEYRKAREAQLRKG